MESRGLFLGRFQPMHLGHLHVVRHLAAQHGELIVAVGSANVSHTEANPFTAGERVAMVAGALREAGLGNVLVVPVPDAGRNAIWVSHVESYVPRFEVLYTNNPLMRRLFEEKGHKVLPAPFHERDRYEGTRVRRLMREGGEWKGLVPPAVARVLEACDGVGRLRDLHGADAVVEGRDEAA